MVFPVSKNGPAHPEKTENEQKKPSGTFKKFLSKQPPIMPPSPRRSIFDVHRQKQLSKPKQRQNDPHIHGHGDQKIERTSAHEIKVSSSSELTADMVELLDKMSDYLMLESKKGISTIEVITNIENSIFNGTVIRIDHYDTAPHSFNIELSHAAQSAIKELTLQLPELIQALENRMEHFQIHFLPPSYLKEKASSDVHKTRKEKIVDKLKQSIHKKDEKNQV